jgi:hypothetical protein
VHEAFIRQTVDAVDALQTLLKSKMRMSALVKRIIAAARSYSHLRNGLLRMVRLASENGEAPKASQDTLAKVAGEINAVKSVPFSYPQAYPDPKTPGPPDIFDDNDTGLPF